VTAARWVDKFVAFDGSLFLYIGTISASFKLSGNIPDSKRILKIEHRIGAIINLAHLINLVPKSLDLDAFLLVTKSIVLAILSGVHGVKNNEL